MANDSATKTVESKPKNTIEIAEIKQISQMEIDIKKTCVVFRDKNNPKNRAYLLGKNLQVTDAKKISPKLYIFSADEIRNKHLGTVKGVIQSIENTLELNKILAAYFAKSESKSKSKTKPKTQKQTANPTPATQTA